MAEHTPVLLQKAIEALNVAAGDTVLDGTVGGGGHAREICKKIGKKGTLVAMDLDAENLSRAQKTLADCEAETHFIQENFRNMDAAVKSLSIEEIDSILLDLGLSSFHLEGAGRGFSFKEDEPLVMTFSAESSEEGITAQTVVNEWSEETLSDIFHGFGEERFARRVARGIAEAREEKKIERTPELVEIIKSSLPKAYKGKQKTITRIFQAIRMAVNDELGALTEALEKGTKILARGGRFAVITFHSGEDRIVKRFFRDKAKEGLLTIHTKRPITPTREEEAGNPRSRSAKLRVAEKI